ncbi:MAG: hypothetical protein AAGI38_15525 [Bacteroidota bacterium]
MKQLVLRIEETKFNFFLELIQNLDFVEIEEDGDSREAIMVNLKQGLEEVKLADQGKLLTTPAKDFLDELQG